MIKISDEQAAKLGITTFDELEAKLTELSCVRVVNKTLSDELKALTPRLDSLDKAFAELPKIDTSAIVTEAVNKSTAAYGVIAERAVSAAIARAGTQGLAPNQPATDGTEAGKPEPAANDYKGQWDKDANLRDEFLGRFSLYEGFKKAEAKGLTERHASR